MKLPVRFELGRSTGSISLSREEPGCPPAFTNFERADGKSPEMGFGAELDKRPEHPPEADRRRRLIPRKVCHRVTDDPIAEENP